MVTFLFYDEIDNVFEKIGLRLEWSSTKDIYLLRYALSDLNLTRQRVSQKIES